MRLFGALATIAGRLLAAILLALSMFVAMGSAAEADVPSPLPAEFTAPQCAGTTIFDPAANIGAAVTDVRKVFGVRLSSYSAGKIVPLYDSYGGSALLDSAGVVQPNQVAYPPLCGTRYVKSAGGAVSEWMFCTDREAQSCGDVDAAGNIVDHDGQPVNPLSALRANPKLTPRQERLNAYLVQNGHTYAGVGNQAWGGVTAAQSDAGTNERTALQTLIWCISDAPTNASDFHTTCDNNMNAAEQARLLALIPDVPKLVLAFKPGAAALDIGDTARFALTTNVYNQPIQMATGGTATTTWSVCSGAATIVGTTLTVAGTNPAVSKNIVLCATAVTRGSATVKVSATPPSTRHIGWSQSVNAKLAEACQVYATFHDVNLTSVSASANATFAAAPVLTPTRSVSTSTPPAAGAVPDTGALPDTGAPVGRSGLLLALGLIGAGVAFAAAGRRNGI